MPASVKKEKERTPIDIGLIRTTFGKLLRRPGERYEVALSDLGRKGIHSLFPVRRRRSLKESDDQGPQQSKLVKRKENR